MYKGLVVLSILLILVNNISDVGSTETLSNLVKCDQAYPTVCIPSPPPDLDCPEINFRNFKVLPPDPHHFDGDRDGIGCED